jgi:TatD DNase family protein
VLHLVDTHCHLNDIAFKTDRSDVINRAENAGVFSFIIPGIDLDSNLKALELADQFAFCHPAIGIHPNTILDWSDRVVHSINDLAQQHTVLAIGETGLDYFRNSVSQAEQKRRFVFHLDLAVKYDLPVILHNRNATPDLLTILSDWCDRIPAEKRIKKYPGVFHAYSGDLDVLDFSKKHGFMLGVGGTLTFPKNLVHVDFLAQHLDKMVLETDSPVLSPQGKRGTRNEPANMVITLESISGRLNMEKSIIAKLTSDNAKKVFRLK